MLRSGKTGFTLSPATGDLSDQVIIPSFHRASPASHLPVTIVVNSDTLLATARVLHEDRRARSAESATILLPNVAPGLNRPLREPTHHVCPLERAALFATQNMAPALKGRSHQVSHKCWFRRSEITFFGL